MNTFDIEITSQDLTKNMIKAPREESVTHKWIGFYFTSEEELFFVSDKGLIVYLDAYLGTVKNIQYV